MAKNERALGLVRSIGPLASGLSSGDLVIESGWPGVVQADIIGTTETERTIDGKEISGEYGDGLGDIQIEGVFKLVDENGATPLADGDLVDRNSPSGVVKASGAGANNTGHVMGDPWTEDSIRYVAVKLLGRPV